MHDNTPLDRRLVGYVQKHIGDAIRLARDPNCQDLLKKLTEMQKARERVIELAEMKLISRHTNYFLHTAVGDAEVVAYYMHYYFEPFWQNAKKREILTAQSIKEKALARLRRESCG